jgi:glycosyltransferase involved in cell wall biosynthesis
MEAATLDILLPCYNPQPGWDSIVAQAYTDITKKLSGVQVRLIMINDGSHPSHVHQLPKTITSVAPDSVWISYPVNQGKGAALRKGMAVSDADISIYTDIDFPYTNDSLVKIWELLASGKADIAAGIKGAAYYDAVPRGRRVISKLLRGMTRLFLGLQVDDTQCGLKGMNTKGRLLFLNTQIDRYLFDLEFIYLASHTKDTLLQPVMIELKPGIVFSRMRLKVLIQECGNFARIILQRFVK